MYTEWTKNLTDPEEKSNFKQQVYHSKEVLDRILTLIDEKEATLDRSETSIEVYSLPNWENRQAHKNGNRESLAWLKKLINLDQQKKDTE